MKGLDSSCIWGRLTAGTRMWKLAVSLKKKQKKYPNLNTDKQQGASHSLFSIQRPPWLLNGCHTRKESLLALPPWILSPGAATQTASPTCGYTEADKICSLLSLHSTSCPYWLFLRISGCTFLGLAMQSPFSTADTVQWLWCTFPSRPLQAPEELVVSCRPLWLC